MSEDAANARRRLAVRRHRVLRAAVGLAAAAVGVVACGEMGPGTGPQSSATDLDRYDPPFIPQQIKPGEPCYHAVEYPLDELVKVVDAPVWMPDSQAASAEKLTSAWSCSGAPVLVFGAVRVSYEPGFEAMKVMTWFEALSSHDPADRIVTILGHPGYVHDGSEKAPNSEVLAVVGDILIRALSEDGVVSGDQMVDIVDSIDLKAPLTAGKQGTREQSR